MPRSRPLVPAADTVSRPTAIRRSAGSGIPLRRATRRDVLKAAAGVAIGGSLIGRGGMAGHAQSMDPYTFITTMPATTGIGQQPGQPASAVMPVFADGMTWSAYIQQPIKEGQDFHFTCEFDSAWIILKSYGHDLDLQEQLAIVGHDLSIEPYWEDTERGTIVQGGDIQEMYSGDYDKNLLARATGNAIRKVFESVDLTVEVTPDRPLIEAALLRGEPVFFKATVDFLNWKPATWVTPDGDEFPVVLTNDHALVVMGFNETDVIIRDPLGPTTTNETRPWQYRVSWERFLEVIAAQGNDALAIGPAPASSSSVRPISGDGTGGSTTSDPSLGDS